MNLKTTIAKMNKIKADAAAKGLSKTEGERLAKELGSQCY